MIHGLTPGPLLFTENIDIVFMTLFIGYVYLVLQFLYFGGRLLLYIFPCSNLSLNEFITFDIGVNGIFGTYAV